MITTPKIKLCTCQRCGDYVFACLVGGFKTMADPTPLDMDGYRAALVAGRAAYRLITVAGRPDHLCVLSAADRGLDAFTLLAQHRCKTRSWDASAMEAAEVPPPRPPAHSSTRAGEAFPKAVPESRTRRSSPARSVRSSPSSQQPLKPGRSSYPLSKVDHDKQWLYRRCERCGEQIGYEPPFGIMYRGMWLYVWHDPCPEKGNE